MDTPAIKKQTNRRGAPRKPARRSIRLQCRKGSLGLGANVGSALLDISETGVQLTTKDALRVGDEVEVVLEGYSMRTGLRRIGQVRWAVLVDAGGCRAGIRFNKLLSFRELQNLAAP